MSTVITAPADAMHARDWKSATMVAGILLFATALRYLVFAVSQQSWDPAAFVEAFCEQDCGWYTSIYEGGYATTIGDVSGAARANWAFFPAYPLLVMLVGKPLGLSASLAGFIVSTGLIFVAALASRPLFGERLWIYWLWVVGLLAGPFSFLFSALYTESLFVLLTLLTLVALKNRSYLGAGLWAAALSATRITGVLMTLGILAQMLRDHLRDGGTLLGFPSRLLREPELLVALALAPVGLALFMVFLHLHTGDALAFVHIQRGWDRALGNPLEVLYVALTSPVTSSYFDLIRISSAIAATLGLVLSVGLMATGRIAAGVFCA
ncbi:MAG: hypothetical protein EOP19_07725, partial [Hyphomicrobiales bacterium]